MTSITRSPVGAVQSDRGSTYRQILSSSAWIGGSTAVNLAIGLVRTKVMAVLLGPAGFGLMGLLTTVADLARSFAEIGINNSGVRQIAEAAASNDQQRIARTTLILRRTALVLGVAGGLGLILVAAPVARLTFGDETHHLAVALLGFAVFFGLVADAQRALLQGLRRTSEVAKVAVLAALIGTTASIPLVYWLREDGVAWAVVAIAAGTAAASWWFARKVTIDASVRITRDVARAEVTLLLKLGLAFMFSGLLMMGTAYAVRMMLVRTHGLDTAGLFQAAWTLGGLYVGFVLQAMGTDFYPRLVGVITRRDECNRVVNEQAYVGMLLASAGVLGTIALSPVVVPLLYSARFEAAAEALRWICLGMALRVISWPLGYVIVASGRQRMFAATELAWASVYLVLSWVFIQRHGLAGAGMAFFASYVFHTLMIYVVVRKQTGFRWTGSNLKVAFLFALAVVLTFGAHYVLPNTPAIALGTLVAAAATLSALRTVRSLLSRERKPPAPEPT